MKQRGIIMVIVLTVMFALTVGFMQISEKINLFMVAGDGPPNPWGPVTCTSQLNGLINTPIKLTANEGSGIYVWSATEGTLSSATGKEISVTFDSPGEKIVSVSSSGVTAVCTISITQSSGTDVSAPIIIQIINPINNQKYEDNNLPEFVATVSNPVKYVQLSEENREICDIENPSADKSYRCLFTLEPGAHTIKALTQAGNFDFAYVMITIYVLSSSQKSIILNIPQQGNTFGGPLFQAFASKFISKVEFYEYKTSESSTLLCTAEKITDPYTYVCNKEIFLSTGVHKIFARGSDSSGNYIDTLPADFWILFWDNNPGDNPPINPPSGSGTQTGGDQGGSSGGTTPGGPGGTGGTTPPTNPPGGSNPGSQTSNPAPGAIVLTPEVRASLPFFDFWNIIWAGILIAIVYSVILLSGRKKR